MRNERLRDIETEINTIRRRLTDLQAEARAELVRELSTLQASVFNAKQAAAALDALGELADTSK